MSDNGKVTLADMTLQNEEEEEEQRLLLQQKRYQLVLDNSDEMMYEIGICEASDIISDRVYEKFGWRIPKQSKNLDAQILMKIWHVVSEDEPQVRLLYDRITKQGRSGRIVVRMQKSDGEFLWCAVTEAVYDLKGDARLPIKNVEIRNVTVGELQC